jgi:hypothetical protein
MPIGAARVLPEDTDLAWGLQLLDAAHKDAFDQVVKASLAQEGGFASTLKRLKWCKRPESSATLKRLKRCKRPESSMLDVTGGVVEVWKSGRVDAALDTDGGPVVMEWGRRTDLQSADPQFASPGIYPGTEEATELDQRSAADLLQEFSLAGENAPAHLVFEVEITRFDAEQLNVLLPLLWRYIMRHRNSNLRSELAPAGAAVRKYIATMPMSDMGRLAVLLDPGQRCQLPLDLEIEIAKMIYRNYEVHPPCAPDPEPLLAEKLCELVEAYTNPRVLLRDKHSAAASVAIEAVVAMRSMLAERAWRAAEACPHRWFAELVRDDLNRLQQQWQTVDSSAANWLANLGQMVVART